MRRPTDEPKTDSENTVKTKRALRVLLVLSLLIAGILGVGLSRRGRGADVSGGNSPRQSAFAAPQAVNVALVQVAGPILPNAPMPHPWRGPCQNCHQILRVAQNNIIAVAANNPLDSPFPQAAGGSLLAAPLPAAPIPLVAPRTRPFHEAHWQGIEVIALTPTLARDLRLGPQDQGVVIDQVSFPADGQGFAGGDLVVRIAGVPTPHLENFVAATAGVREANQTNIDVIRNGRPVTVVLVANRLGSANGETPPIIPPDAAPPGGCARAHAALMNLEALGPCTDCHTVKARGPLPLDLAEVLPKPAVSPVATLHPLCLPPPAF